MLPDFLTVLSKCFIGSYDIGIQNVNTKMLADCILFKLTLLCDF